MYRTMVTICTAQWSLYVPHSGHYVYSTVVTICTAQWSLYVPHSGHYVYSTVVTICTTSLAFTNSSFCPHSVFMCFVWISEQTAIISLYNIIWLVFITETESVYCAVRTGSLKTIQVNFCLWQGSDHEPSKDVTQDSYTDWVTEWMDDWWSLVKSLWLSLKEILQSIHCRFPLRTATWVSPYHCTQYLCFLRSHSMN
jgi:hypothetical protein